MDKKNKFVWPAVFLFVAIGTIWALTSQNRSFSIHAFVEYLHSASPGWLLAAVLAALSFVIFEGVALQMAARPFGYRISFRRGFLYSAADIYCSAITPSATGGQPACAYFMIKGGLSGSVTAAILLVNLTMYTLSILLIGILVFLLFPRTFLSFSVLSKVLILIGLLLQLLLSTFLLLLLKNERLLQRIARTLLHLLCRLHLLRHEEERQEKLSASMHRYEETVRLLRGKSHMMTSVFLMNLLQRTASISVSMFVFLASGGSLTKAPLLWIMQCFVVLGSNSIPIPGAMGVSDYLMLDSFGTVMSAEQAANLELLSRSLSFYLCVILCGILTFAAYFLQKRKERLC